MHSFFRVLIVILICVAGAGRAVAASIPPPGNEISLADRAELEKGSAALAKEIEDLRSALKDRPNLLALLPDVQIYHKGVDWPLRYHELIDVKKARLALQHGMERARQLRDGQTPWVVNGGVRAYLSKIDGSVQPYMVMMPADYNEAKKRAPYRLDFFYHGRGENLTELNFISGKPGEAFAPVGEHFTVHPYGRYCCANKFAGEIDTLEILDRMKREYPIDENRVLVTGFSMGGAACWHMAVHYADLWAAASPGAGFCETRIYQNMDKSGEWAVLPEYQKKLMHLYDCPDYALNLSMLPTIAYAGEIDPQQQSGDIMQKAMEGLGYKLERIYGPKTGHKYEAEAKKELDKRLAAYAERGRNPAPKEIHFETWTLRYNRMYWVTVDGLEKHWERARVDGEVKGNVVSLKTVNVSAMTLQLPSGLIAAQPRARIQVKIDGLDTANPIVQPDGTVTVQYLKTGNMWHAPFTRREVGLVKRHELQGPIDDAFLDAFVVVKPTGRALNEKVGEWTLRELEHAADQWRKIFRGEAPIKGDGDIRDADIANSNLILFGDPSSNSVLKRIAEKLPIQWDSQGITLNGKTYPADHHALIMIYPNPLNPAEYVVLNSGFTFREADHKTNSRQIAKLPDYTIVDLNTPPDDKSPGAIPRAGFFDESWRLQK
jgi:pimeloyl-ACP methyl ester carboxylesterase